MRSNITSLAVFMLLILGATGAVAEPSKETSATTDALAAGSTVVEIVAPDGVKLAATYTSPGKPGPGVLLFHMCNSDRSAWASLAQQLAARGIHTLAYDYRGYGDSGGEQGEGDDRRQIRDEIWPQDADAVFDYLRSRPGVDKAHIGAGGGSCGVDQSIHLARRHPGQVTTLALLAGGVNTEGTDFLAENPWLPIFASASLDDGLAVSEMRWLLGFSSHSDNRFREYPHGGHGTEMFAVHAELEPQIAEWFQRYLIDKPVRRPAEVSATPGPSFRLWQELTAPDGVARLRKRLKSSKASGGGDLVMPPEVAINAEGYRLIGAGEAERAIEMLALNVEMHPKSANALDSLGDAYLAAEQPKKAAEYARLAIAAIPKDPEISEDFARAVRESAESKLIL